MAWSDDTLSMYARARVRELEGEIASRRRASLERVHAREAQRTSEARIAELEGSLALAERARDAAQAEATKQTLLARQVRREQMEADCRLRCLLCRSGFPATLHCAGRWVHYTEMVDGRPFGPECHATDIREGYAAAIKEAEK